MPRRNLWGLEISGRLGLEGFRLQGFTVSACNVGILGSGLGRAYYTRNFGFQVYLNPKICKIVALGAIVRDFELLFCRLLGPRQELPRSNPSKD